MSEPRETLSRLATPETPDIAGLLAEAMPGTPVPAPSRLAAMVASSPFRRPASAAPAAAPVAAPRPAVAPAPVPAAPPPAVVKSVALRPVAPPPPPPAPPAPPPAPPVAVRSAVPAAPPPSAPAPVRSAALSAPPAPRPAAAPPPPRPAAAPPPPPVAVRPPAPPAPVLRTAPTPVAAARSAKPPAVPVGAKRLSEFLGSVNWKNVAKPKPPPAPAPVARSAAAAPPAVGGDDFDFSGEGVAAGIDAADAADDIAAAPKGPPVGVRPVRAFLSELNWRNDPARRESASAGPAAKPVPEAPKPKKARFSEQTTVAAMMGGFNWD